MKTARIKRGRRKEDLFLLESVDSRITIAHKKISNYRQKGIQTKITKTILDEFDGSKVRRIIDEKCHFLNYAQRMHVINQVLRKRREIILRFAPHFNINPSDIRELLENVTNFYKDPDKRQELEEISRRKGSDSTFPSLNDRKILAECCFIRSSEKKETVLMSDDAHFTRFSRGIKDEFDVDIDPVM